MVPFRRQFSAKIAILKVMRMKLPFFEGGFLLFVCFLLLITFPFT